MLHEANEASQGGREGLRGSVVKYNDDMEAYLECIKTEYDAKVAAQTDATPQQKAEMEKVQTQKHNAAVDEVTEVTNDLNEQRRAYRAKAAADKDKKPS